MRSLQKRFKMNDTTLALSHSTTIFLYSDPLQIIYRFEQKIQSLFFCQDFFDIYLIFFFEFFVFLWYIYICKEEIFLFFG